MCGTNFVIEIDHEFPIEGFIPCTICTSGSVWGKRNPVTSEFSIEEVCVCSSCGQLYKFTKGPGKQMKRKRRKKLKVEDVNDFIKVT